MSDNPSNPSADDPRRASDQPPASDPTPPPGGATPPPPSSGATPPPPPAPAPAPDHGAQTGAGAPATLGIRFGARLLDSILVGIVVAIIAAIIPGMTTAGPIASVISTLAGFGYFVYLESSRGQTLFKQLFNLRVVDASGGAVTMEDAAKRNWWLLLGLLGIIPFLGILAGLASLAIAIWIAVTISSDAANRGVHDKWGGTQVLRTK